MNQPVRQVVEAVQVTVPLDVYFSLRAAAGYCSLSVSTLRGYLTFEPPLPHYRVNGKVLLRRSELDAWLRRFRSVGAQDLDRLVEGVLGELKGESNKALGGPGRQPRARKGSPGSGPGPVAGE